MPWRHMWEWTYRSTFSWPQRYLEVSGQLHTPTFSDVHFKIFTCINMRPSISLSEQKYNKLADPSKQTIQTSMDNPSNDPPLYLKSQFKSMRAANIIIFVMDEDQKCHADWSTDVSHWWMAKRQNDAIPCLHYSGIHASRCLLFVAARDISLTAIVT
jgi:hypothetical protein